MRTTQNAKWNQGEKLPVNANNNSNNNNSKCQSKSTGGSDPSWVAKEKGRAQGGKSESLKVTEWQWTHTRMHKGPPNCRALQYLSLSLSLFSFPLLCRFCYLPSCILAPWHMKPPWGGSERTKVQKPLGNFINNKLSDALMTWKYTYMTRQASHVQTASYMEAPQLWSCLPSLPACLSSLSAAWSIQNAPLSLSAKRFRWQNSFFLFFFISFSLSPFLSSLFYSFCSLLNLWNLLCSCIWHEAFGATKPFDRPSRS